MLTKQHAKETPTARLRSQMRLRQRQYQRKRLLLVGLILGVIVLALLALGYQDLAHAKAKARQGLVALRAAQQNLQEQPPIKVTPAILDAATQKLQLAETDFKAAQATFSRYSALLPFIARLPGQEDVAAARVLPLAIATTRAGETALAGLRPIAVAIGPVAGPVHPGQAPLSERFLQGVATGRPKLELALQELEQVQGQFDRLPAATLSGNLGAELSTGRAKLPLAMATLRALLVAPHALGDVRPRRYLVIVQNPQDLRPSGGVIGNWGLLEMSHGRMVSLDYRSSQGWERTDNGAHRALLSPPSPYSKYLGLHTWSLPDAGWSPDFPTAARQIEGFAQRDQALAPDGVIALDTTAFTYLLAVTGPVAVPTYQPVNATSFLALTDTYDRSKRTGDQQPGIPARNKSFLTAATHAILTQLQHLPPERVPALLTAFAQAIQDRHIQVYSNDQEAQGIAHTFSWDGALAQNSGDSLLINDASMSDSKIAQYVQRRGVYQVERLQDGSWRAKLTLVYHHTITPAQFDLLGHTQEFRDFQRIFVPSGSTLLNTSGLSDVSQSVDLQHTVFSGYTVLKPGQTKTLIYTYLLPRSAPTLNNTGAALYMLTLQKQAGVAPYPLQIIVSTESGAAGAGGSSTKSRPVPQHIQILLQRDQQLIFPLQPVVVAR